MQMQQARYLHSHGLSPDLFSESLLSHFPEDFVSPFSWDLFFLLQNTSTLSMGRKEGRKALWVCRETHDENPKDRCIQVKEYRGHGTLCILEVRGGGDRETALSWVWEVGNTRTQCQSHLHWQAQLLANNRPFWAKEGHGWYPKLLSYLPSQGCSSAIHYQAASPEAWSAIFTFVRGLTGFLCFDGGLSNCIFKEVWPHPDL